MGGLDRLYRVSSYHDANELLSVADHARATAVHPGYGFFAEDFRFARRVTERTNRLEFIGPSWRIIRSLGDKINTKRLARSLSIPTVPGSDRPVYDELEAEEIAETLFAFQAEQGVEQSVVLVKPRPAAAAWASMKSRHRTMFQDRLPQGAQLRQAPVP